MDQLTHPPHIMDKNNQVSASAFIPFCLYQSHPIKVSGIEMETIEPNISFPACSSFEATVVEGQLCYKLDLQLGSGEGKKNELIMMLDYNQHLSIRQRTKTSDIDSGSFYLNTLDRGLTEAKIQIKTLSRRTNFGGGSYKMTAVKRMTANSDFLEMSSEERHCEVEEYEDCRTRRLFEACKCVPWEISGYKVIRRYHICYILK